MSRRVLRLATLLWLCVCLSGCWFVVRFVDDQSLTLDKRFHGRWKLADGSGELVIAHGAGCAIVQFIADDELLRLCSLATADDYVLTAFYDMSDDRAVREYTLGVARWYSADRVGLVMLDGKVALDELTAPYALELRDAQCSTRDVSEQEQAACSRLLLDVTQLPPPSTTALAKLYATGCCSNDQDESILLRISAVNAAAMEE